MEFSNHYFAICHLEIYKTKLYNSEKYHFVNHPLVLVYQPTNNSIPNNTPKNEKEFRHHLILCTDKKFLLFTPVFCSRPYAKISSHDGVSQSQDNFWKSGGGNARLEKLPYRKKRGRPKGTKFSSLWLKFLPTKIFKPSVFYCYYWRVTKISTD